MKIKLKYPNQDHDIEFGELSGWKLAGHWYRDYSEIHKEYDGGRHDQIDAGWVACDIIGGIVSFRNIYEFANKLWLDCYGEFVLSGNIDQQKYQIDQFLQRINNLQVFL